MKIHNIRLYCLHWSIQCRRKDFNIDQFEACQLVVNLHSFSPLVIHWQKLIKSNMFIHICYYMKFIHNVVQKCNITSF